MQSEKEKYESFRIATPEGYKELFSHFYYAANFTSESVTKTLLPSYQTILIFTFGVKPFLVSAEGFEIEVGDSLVLGPVKHSFDYKLPPEAEILVVNFEGDTFYRFFGEATVPEHVPMNPDSLIMANCFTDLWILLNEEKDVNKRISLILEFCAPYLKKRNAIVGQLEGFVGDGMSSVKAVAQANHLTERSIQLLHKKHLGYSAKELGRYNRFLKVIRLLQEKIESDVKTDWFEIVERCGYYDQSQLIRDFKHYINLSPKQYLKFQQDICIAKD
ncbi:helix-turn-helix domain-containing protein [Flavobacterium amniphilum]|uniref:AraC family transcriptional regulator n=1 Tax=Flavobacterium amniphilum TaxID=1834035 RepID=UPI002029E84D|nr:helix-turn-helix domain-containing protein [Flavobacterium amniphilum]MCL9806434.1 helix-turn-helix domain-containing protein [Flavobacterium amniphilum]